MSFKEMITSNTQLGYFEGEIPVNYQYTLGVAGNRFFQTLKDNDTFIASECSNCGIKTIYPLIYCEECFSPIERFVQIGLEGELYSFTESWFDYQGNRYDQAHPVVFVRFPGIKGGIIHRINKHYGELTIGMKVRAKLKPKKERSGTIDDIECFELA